MNGITLEMARSKFKGAVVRPAWVRDGFSEITDIREIPVNKSRNMFLAYLKNGVMVNLNVLKDKDNKFVMDTLGGVLDSTSENEGK